MENILDKLNQCVEITTDGELQYAILDYKKAEPILHQQLQKAREEEREKKANELQEMLDGYYSQAIYEWRPDNYVAFIRKAHHSELDQDTPKD